MIAIHPINPPRVLGTVFGADFNRHFKQPHNKKKYEERMADDTINDSDGNFSPDEHVVNSNSINQFSPERQQRFSVSDDDLHLYMSQSQQSDDDLEEKADSVKRSGKNSRPESATGRAKKYSRLVSIDSESDINLDETNVSHNQSLKLRTPLTARRISACSTHVLVKDKSETGLLNEILQNQKEILMAMQKNEIEIGSQKTKPEEREANVKEPIQVPLQIRNAVHEAYASGLDRGMAWQFDKKRFSDQSNYKMTDFIKSYVQRIYPTVDCLVLKEIRKKTHCFGQERILEYENKEEVRKVLDKNYMGSDEEGADGGVISHPPSWESDTFQKVKEILDKKLYRHMLVKEQKACVKEERGSSKRSKTPLMSQRSQSG